MDDHCDPILSGRRSRRAIDDTRNRRGQTTKERHEEYQSTYSLELDRNLECYAETGRRVVYPWLCDQMGHLATQHYMAFFDDAFYHLILMIVGGQSTVSGSKAGWADVRHEVIYSSELKGGDLVVLKSAVQAIGRKSLTHVTHMFRTSDDCLCATVTSSTVRFDLGRRVAIPIEQALREAITRSGLLMDAT